MSSIKKTDHFYLVDGSGYIFRAYYALPPLTRKSDGLPTGAVNGFCNMLFKLLRDSISPDNREKPTHFAVIFDSARKNFRNEIYKDYKANRSDPPDDLAPQFEYIRKSVLAFNLPSVEKLNYEADDLIATYAEMIKKIGAKVTVISSDKDLMQLVSKQIRLYDPMKGKFISEADVKEKFGVKPNQVIDVQALAGDSSDNVPGVPGIGIKTASELINQFSTLENLLKNLNSIKQKKRKETLIENSDSAILSKKLVTLKKDVPISESIEALSLKKMDRQKLYTFLRDMEFNRLLSQAISIYGETSFENKGISKKGNEKFDLKKYKLVESDKELDKIVEEINSKKYIAVDTETSSLNAINAKLLGVSICIDPNKAFYIPIDHKNFKGPEMSKTLIKIKKIFENPNIIKIGQNIKYDILVLKKYNINISPIDDTMLISYVLDAGLNRHGLDTLSELHLNHKTISYKDITGTGKKKISFDEVEIKKAAEYASEDADVTFRLYKYLKDRIKKENLNEVYEHFEKPMIEILANMEKNGIKIDSSYLKNLSKIFLERIVDLEKNIYKLAKKKFNIGSPKQLGEIIYNELKIAKLKKTKKGSLATSASVLEDLALEGHKFPKLILEWRQLSKLKNTYTDALQDHLNQNTKRIHTSFLLAATNTGRLASSEPNLQNIPIKTEDGKRIRKAFISEKDNVLISADYNQVEMRILADLADVKELKKAFRNKVDIHSLTASQVFNTPINKIDQEKRRKAKAINFGIIYGITQYGLAKQISVSNNEALDFINAYFKKFPEIKSYMNDTIRFCRKNGFVNNIFGRRIHLKNINDKNYAIRSFQERAAINAPIQSSAADIIRLAMIKISSDQKQKKIPFKMLLQIHDELIVETSEKNKMSVLKFVKDSMISVSSSKLHKFSIPLEVNIDFGYNWGEIH